MKSIFPVIIFGLLLTVSFHAQTITDADRRAFENLDEIKIDVDGDGNLDTIQPRTFQTTVWRMTDGKKTGKEVTRNWITFDLITSKGSKINSFFKYNYGTAE
jgi:hypothetical protein